MSISVDAAVRLGKADVNDRGKYIGANVKRLTDGEYARRRSSLFFLWPKVPAGA